MNTNQTVPNSYNPQKETTTETRCDNSIPQAGSVPDGWGTDGNTGSYGKFASDIAGRAKMKMNLKIPREADGGALCTVAEMHIHLGGDAILDLFLHDEPSGWLLEGILTNGPSMLSFFQTFDATVRPIMVHGQVKAVLHSIEHQLGRNTCATPSQRRSYMTCKILGLVGGFLMMNYVAVQAMK